MDRDEVITQVNEYLLGHGVRGAMRTAIGDSTPRQYDAADTIALGLRQSIAQLLSNPGAAEIRQMLREIL